MRNLFGVYLTDILKEMCSRVDTNFEDIDFRKDNWYLEHSWTEDAQNDFIAWFAKQLIHKGVRNELSKYPSLLKSYEKREEFAKQFVDEFGWKVENKYK